MPECPICHEDKPLRVVKPSLSFSDKVFRLREALEFYADPKHWESVLIRQVPDDEPNGGAQEWESGPAVDGGLRARRALLLFDGDDRG